MNKSFRVIFSLLSLCVFILFLFSCITIGGGKEKQRWYRNGKEYVSKEKKAVTVERKIQPFTGVKASTGIVAVISQSQETKAEVCADENLQQYVHLDVVDGVLNIYMDGHFSSSEEVKVYVKTPVLNSLVCSAGARIKIEDSFQTDEINIHASSGSIISAVFNAKKITISAGSGSIASLKGTALYLDASSSSGSILKTVDLKADVCVIHASSGSVCKINSVKEIHGHVSSGAIITDYGTANVEDIQASSGGLFKHKTKD